jgi:hypothetical protein
MQMVPGANREVYLAVRQDAMQDEALLEDRLEAATDGGAGRRSRLRLLGQAGPQVRARVAAAGLAEEGDPGRWQSSGGYRLLLQVGAGGRAGAAVPYVVACPAPAAQLAACVQRTCVPARSQPGEGAVIAE